MTACWKVLPLGFLWNMACVQMPFLYWNMQFIIPFVFYNIKCYVRDIVTIQESLDKENAVIIFDW